MTTNVKCLKAEIDCRLAGGGLDSLRTCQLQNSEAILNNCIVYSVPCTANLPSTVNNVGRLVYIQDINEYRYSTGDAWVDDLSSEVGTQAFQIFVWGVNTCGGLGNGTTTNTCSPVLEVSSSTNWCIASFGANFSSAIKTDGSLWSWGDNFCFALGNGTSIPTCSPVREWCSDTNWQSVDTGSRCFTMGLKKNGEIWAWGLNAWGNLGDGTAVNRCSPVRERCSATNWCCIGAGQGSLHAIKTDGSLWSWGLNNLLALGDGTNTSRCSPVREICSASNWKTLSAGFYRVGAIKTDGSLWGWGCNTVGQLADGTTINRCSPIREICSATDWCSVSMARGSGTNGAIKNDGSLWMWGAGDNGRLGDGTAANKCSPIREICSATDWCLISAGGSISAIKTDGTLWGWGTFIAKGSFASVCSPVREICSATDWIFAASGSSCGSLGIRGLIKGFLE